LTYIDGAILILEGEAISAVRELGMLIGVKNMYWLMCTLLSQAMSERESFSHVVDQTLCSVCAELIQIVPQVEEVISLIELPFHFPTVDKILPPPVEASLQGRDDRDHI